MSTVAKRFADTLRLMVGIGDYARYCEHMRAHHAGAPVMSEAEYFRYCQQARFPSKAGQIRRCPC